jgi:hypothetical protein
MRVIELRPEFVDGHLAAGRILKRMKAYEQACLLFEKAVEIDSRNAEALHQLAAVRALHFVHGGVPSQAVTI